MISNQDKIEEPSPIAIFHFSEEVSGTQRHRAEARLRSRQPFQITHSVAVARIADK